MSLGLQVRPLLPHALECALPQCGSGCYLLVPHKESSSESPSLQKAQLGSQLQACRILLFPFGELTTVRTYKPWCFPWSIRALNSILIPTASLNIGAQGVLGVG